MAFVWRFGYFFAEWARLLAWGDSLAGRLAKYISVGIAVGLLRMLTEPVHIILWTPGRVWFQYETTAGILLMVALALLVLIATAGAAWSRSPRLWMANRLEEDREHRYVRLKVENRAGGSPSGEVHLMAVVDKDGNHLVEPILLPLELHWTDHPGERPPLSSGIPKSIGVAHFPSRATIRFEGMHAPREVLSRCPDGTPRTVWFELSGNFLGKRKYTKRWFALEPTNEAPLYHRALSGPPSSVTPVPPVPAEKHVDYHYQEDRLLAALEELKQKDAEKKNLDAEGEDRQQLRADSQYPYE